MDTIRQILETSRNTVEYLLAMAPNDTDLLNSKSMMLDQFSVTYHTAGDLKDATSNSSEAVSIARKLVAENPSDPVSQMNLSIVLEGLADIELDAGDVAHARDTTQEIVDIRKHYSGLRGLAVALERLGDVKLRSGDLTGAIQAFGGGLEIDRQRIHSDTRRPKTTCPTIWTSSET